MKINKVSILGCGWLGLPLSLALAEAGFEVTTASRSPQPAQLVDDYPSAVTHLTQPIEVNQSISPQLLDCDLLLINIPCKSLKDYAPLLLALEKKPDLRVIYVSSTSVYQASKHELTENRGPYDLSSPIYQIEQALQAIENIKLNIVRFGGLIGYNRHPARFVAKNRLMASPNHRVNMIHRDDCISILHRLIVHNRWGLTLNACTDSHPLRLDFYTQAARHAGLSLPDFAQDNPAPGKWVSNEKLKKELNYQFLHPDLLAWSQLPYLLPH